MQSGGGQKDARAHRPMEKGRAENVADSVRRGRRRLIRLKSGWSQVHILPRGSCPCSSVDSAPNVPSSLVPRLKKLCGADTLVRETPATPVRTETWTKAN